MFTNTQIDIESLPKMETIDLVPIEKSYYKIIVFNILISYLSVIGILSFIYINLEKGKFLKVAPYLITLLVLVLIFHLIISTLGFKNRKYAMREKDIIHTKGLLEFNTTVLPFNRIQHVEISRSLLARKLNLSKLEIYTAGESGSDLTISGLPKDVAERINNHLTKMLNERV